MTSEVSTLYARIATIEARLLDLQAQYQAVLTRLAADEQEIGQIGTTLGFGGSEGGGGIWFAVSTTAISARSGSTAGSGTVQLLINAAGALSNGQTVTCYNNSSNALNSGKNCVVGQDASGNYDLINGDC